MKTVKVIKESPSGRNIQFKDTRNGRVMSRSQFVCNIENGGTYSKDYGVRKINGVKTPVSKPDNSKKNNLK